jgi:NAD(P)-dependent dehydrogenase (short-subunit alcohol dehydrogenase family)
MKILVAGSSGAIGQKIVEQLRSDGDEVFTISRSGAASPSHCVVDLTLSNSVDLVLNFLSDKGPLDAVFCCIGMLHGGWNMPEKSLSQLSDDWLQQSMAVNVLSHVHLAQAVEAFVARRQPIRWLSLSAMVGSIADNQLGGWYSYRMSKAALNMFIKTLSIEWGRKSPDSCVVALHPGTTESGLSKPFQAGIAEGKLYSQQETAKRLVQVMRELTPAQHGRLLHWDGSELPF